MLNYKIIASDLDGTLLKEDKTISQENLDAIKKFAEMGGIFVPTTGRSVGELPDELISNPHVRYVICSDGTGIFDKEVGKCEFDFMPHDVLMQALDVILDYDVHMVLHYDNAAYSNTTKQLFAAEQLERIGNLAPLVDYFTYTTHKPSFREFCDSLKGAELLFIYFWDKSQLDECVNRLNQIGEYNILCSAESSIEIIRKTSGKGLALLRLADMLGVKKEETIGVGDNTNDNNLIECAGLGLAMGNAVDALKDIADRVICTNEEHNIDYIVKNIIK